MDNPDANLRLLSKCMDKMHILVSDIRAHAEKTGNMEACVAAIELDVNVCIGLRSIRKTLDIPYDWHERKPDSDIPDEKAQM